MNAIANLDSVVEEINKRFVARAKNVSILERPILVDTKLLVVGFPLWLDSAPPIS